ncbi:DUF3124 domain-containing protein [Desulfatitalea tepidiphila]|uniref:DUF3124 domain-containing protein n=1 Tax=Desulfatitalea tepidiphila TaxID=1185843 RepID=UPI0009774315|nr:DUF3124 domain-containing protein [Desulfatitalea tepidiphila]
MTVRGLLCSMVIVGCLAFGIVDAIAQNKPSVSRGQILYVPVYSHIYIGDRERPFLLTVTLSIRNTDRNFPITIQKVVYYDSNGKPLNAYLDKPMALEKLSSTRFVVRESDKSGGSGASFMVEWESDQAVSPPLVETIMIGAQTQQGISFTSRGLVIEEK